MNATWRHVAATVAGFAVASAVFALLPDTRYMRTFNLLKNVKRYELFNPLHRAQEKHVLIGSCDTINNVAYNDVWNERDVSALHRHGTAYMGQVLSFVLEREYGSDAAFYDMGASATGVTEHLWYLAHVLDAPNVRTIVYSNGPGGLGSFKIQHRELNLYVEAILEQWRGEFPEARPYIDEYLQEMRASPYYQELLEADPDAPRELQARMLPGPHRGRRFLEGFVRLRSLERCAGAANLLVADWSLLGEGRDRRWQGELLANLDLAAGAYGNPIHDRAFEMWDTPNRLRFPRRNRALAAFMNILGAVTRARGIRLVYYFEPRLSLTDESYEHFREDFIAGVREILEPWGCVFIDHTIDHDLTPDDVYWAVRKGGEITKRGHHVNLVGNYKRSRRLIEAMARLGLLDGAPDESPEPAWAGLGALPAVDRPIRGVADRGEDAD